VYGHYVRELRSVIAGGDEPPEFEDWGDLLADGVKLFVVTLVYVVPAVLVFLVPGMGGSVMDGMDPGILVSFGSLAYVVVGVLSIPLLVAMLWPSPVVLAASAPVILAGYLVSFYFFVAVARPFGAVYGEVTG